MNTQKSFDFNELRNAGEQFMASILGKMNDLGIPAQTMMSDHLCFRTATREEYVFYKTEFLQQGELLTEAMVNGRPISTFRLHSPFRTEHHTIPLLELPSPKDGVSYATGFEHAEFIIQECFTSFRKRFPHLDFIESGHQNLNPELCLNIGDGIQAKFHHLSLDRIIELEEAEIKDIIFDFDGTLINSRVNIYEINRIIFSDALGRELSLQESIDNFHTEFSKLFEAFALTCPIKQSETIEKWGSVASQFNPLLFDGVLETLQDLKKNGFRLHLWTARDEASSRQILKQHGIENFFETLSFANNRNSKPHQSNLRFNWERAAKNGMLMVGDSSTDMAGARNISAIRVAALWDEHVARSSLIESGAELFFYEVSEFKNWVLRQIRTPKK